MKVREFSLTNFLTCAEEDKCVLHLCVYFACDTAATILSLHLLVSEVFTSKLLTQP